MRDPLITLFNALILKSGYSNKINLLLQADNIKEDLLAPSTRKQEEIEVSVLRILSNFRGLMMFDTKKITILCLFKSPRLFQRTNQP